MSFNREFAAKVYDLISKMDDDTATMFVRLVTHDVLHDDIASNSRTVSKAVNEILEEIKDEVSKALGTQNDERAVVTAALVSVVSKDAFKTNYEELYHRPQPRDAGGRWAVTFSASKTKPSKYKERRNKTVAVGDFDVPAALGRAGKNTNEFAERWNARANEESTTSRMYNRIEAGSKLLAETGNATGSAKLRLAGEAGQFLGKYGPQAESVIGPHLRRTAYRYRGTERTPDAALRTAQKEQIAEIGRAEGLKDNSEFTTPMMNTASQKASIKYLMSRLPSKSLADLQQKSGKIPPSEGVIINADGKVITQAVGYMDDHYLPFNLKNLKGLQGGSYVRSRSSGGLTTEDIYAGLMSGARSVTVVSRSGIFTVDFEDDFRGGRRYNDKALGMISRYAKTLDAVQSKQVNRRAMSTEEKLKIREEVEEEMYGFKPDEVEAEIKRRVQDASTRPTISSSEMREINEKAVSAAAEGGQGPRGQFSQREWDRIKDDPKKRVLAYRSQMIEDLMREKEATKFQLDGEGYAVALDALREQYPYYIQNVEYIHNKEPRAVALGLSPEVDSGYVKPRFNRPAGAQEGYFDTSITGKGKITADRTNFQNIRARGKETAETAEGEETEKPKVATAAKVRDNIERGKKQSRIDEEYRSLISTTRGVDVEAKDYPLLTQARAGDDKLNEILNGPKRGDFEAELDKLAGQLAVQTEPGLKAMSDQVQTHKRTVEALKTTMGNEQFDPRRYAGGASPVQPYLFEGNEYAEGQSAETYRRGWEQVKHQIGAMIPGFELTPGQDLRTASTHFGALAKLAYDQIDNAKDVADLVGDVARHFPQASAEQIRTYAEQISRTPQQAAQRWSRVVESMERARRIEAVSGDALAERTAPAAQMMVTSTATEISRADSRDAMVADAAQYMNSANDHDVRSAFHKIHRGLVKHDQDSLYEGLADLSEADPTGSRVIEARLRKLGLVDDDFE